MAKQEMKWDEVLFVSLVEYFTVEEVIFERTHHTVRFHAQLQKLEPVYT